MSTDIATMPAGPELDALISEKVMGFKWDDTRCRKCGWPLDPEGRLCRPDDCSMRPQPKGRERADAIPLYSTDHTRALEVLLRFTDAVIAVTRFNGGPWAVRISREANFILTPFEQDASLPLAICRAALRAVGT